MPRTKSILVVEDHTDTREILTIQLKMNFDCRILEARDGEEAVRVALETHPDVILMDLNLPCLDGAEATRLIKAHDDMSATTVIAASNYYWDQGWKQRALDAGCSKCIDKGLMVASLGALIRPYMQ